MPISNYLYGLRQKVGNTLLLLPAVTMICRNDEGRVLLARHQDYDQWALPGGGIDPGEKPADAAVREMWEETGLLVEPVRIQGVYGGPAFQFTYPNGDQVASVDTAFVCRISGGQLAADGEEIRELRYFAPSELAELPLAPWMRIVLADLDRDQAQSCFQAPVWQPPADGVRKGGASDYVQALRQQIGHDLLLLPGVGALVFDDQGRLLLQQRADNQRWALPVGGMDPGEAPADAALREVWEETGIRATAERVLGVYGSSQRQVTHANGDQTTSVFTAFVCRAVTNTPTPDGIESIATGFFPVAEAMTLLAPHWQQRLSFALTNPPTAQFEPATWRPA